MAEKYRMIECTSSECDNWEMFPADMPRKHSQNFECVTELENNEAVYCCMKCHELTISTTEDKE